LLHQTSRSFYLTLRMLPAAVRPQIGLAYLLARTTDTIADTEIVPVLQRLEALHALRERILGRVAKPLDLGDLVRHQGLPAERALLEQVETTVAALRDLSAADIQLIRAVLETIISGQEMDLKRFTGASAQNIIALQTDAELDDYTYRVAGCVGEFWTRMCRAHLFPVAPLDEAFLLTNGVRFGKGLQLVNILRDLPRDLRQGRCYIPLERLTAERLTPTDLLGPNNESRFRPLYETYLKQAESHLAAGWAYTNALPRASVRIRLACAWPILIGIRTIKRLRRENMLDPLRIIKVSRSEVRALIVFSVLNYPFQATWERQFARAK
jgi:farnesyl-diphosphate farnesyltransferase